MHLYNAVKLLIGLTTSLIHVQQNYNSLTMFCIVCVRVYVDGEGSPPKKQKSAKSSSVSASNNVVLVAAKHNMVYSSSEHIRLLSRQLV